MNGVKITIVLALLSAGLAKAGDDTGTNQMPDQVPNLMKSEDYALDYKNFRLRNQNTNSLRNIQFIERRRFIPLVLPVKKAGWSLWNNSSFKHAGIKNDQTSQNAPFSAIAHVEYDIMYSITF